MIEPEITREELFALAASPIGGEDARAALSQIRPGDKTPPALKEASKRASKIWLPRGRKRRVPPPECATFQTDLEDAVEAAGGQRGSLG